MAEVNNVTVNEEIVEPTVDLVTYKPAKTFGNIATGAGIAVGGALALYGLFDLGKKAVGAIRKHMEKRKEAMNHPVYEYKKLETKENQEKEDIPKAKLQRKKKKNPIGFRYEA